jgi:hypothetical protein
MLEQKIALQTAMKEKKGRGLVYELFIKYEDSFDNLKNPSQKDKDDYTKLYFEYVEYIQRREK